MDRIVANAPNRVFVAAEYGFAWGSKAIVAPVEFGGRRNTVSLVSQEGRGKVVVYYGAALAVLDSDGRTSGDKFIRPFLESIKTILSSSGVKVDQLQNGLSMSLEYSGAPKGTANSASMSAALCSVVYEYLGLKPSLKEYAGAVLATEKLFSADAASEVDVRAVLSDSPLKVKREFLLDGSVKVRYEEARLSLPTGTELLFVDTSAGNAESAENPEALHNRFAKSYGFVGNTGKIKAPQELTAGERAKVSDPLNSIVDRIAAEMSPAGSPEKLASLLDLNQAILADAGVSSKGIEDACALAKKEGGLGAKISGAGGDGGAILVYCKSKSAAGIREALKTNGYSCYEISLSDRGASVYR